MKILRLLCILALLTTSVAYAEAPVSFEVDDSGHLAIAIQGQSVANYTWNDPEISRPYFSGVKTLGGQQVTRRHPPDPQQDVADHPTFHPGIWLTFGDISGSDYWRLKAPTKLVEGSLQTSTDEQSASFQAKFQYLQANDSNKLVCEEQFQCTFFPHGDGYFILWDSTFSHDQPFWFGDQEEMGIGFRVATPLRAETRARSKIAMGTGTILDADGRRNGTEVWGYSSRWCDYSGELEGKKVGMTLMCHPENFRPSWFHARDYGLLVANAFGRSAFRKGDPSKVEVAPGESLRLRYGIYVHAATESDDIDSAYQDYLKLSGTN